MPKLNLSQNGHNGNHHLYVQRNILLCVSFLYFFKYILAKYRFLLCEWSTACSKYILLVPGKQKPKRPFEKVAESKLEIAGIQKQFLEEELENKRKQWSFEEEERQHKRAMWALERQLLQNKIDKIL